MEAHPVAYVALLEYALISLVERSVESVHAIVKRIGKQMTRVSVPWISARLRERYLLDLLGDAGFWRCCVEHFRRRSLLDDILKLRFCPKKLATLTVSAKTNAVYQCSLESQYDTKDRAHDAARQFKLEKSLALPESALPSQCKVCVTYLKSLLNSGYFTVPTDF